jgi:hypothetical protein
MDIVTTLDFEAPKLKMHLRHHPSCWFTIAMCKESNSQAVYYDGSGFPPLAVNGMRITLVGIHAPSKKIQRPHAMVTCEN